MTVLTITVTPPGQQQITFTSDNVAGMPENIPSTMVSMAIPGKEGGALQYLGSPPKRLQLTVLLKTISAKADLDKLKAIRAAGVPCQVTITAFDQTWIQADYLVAHLAYDLEPGTPQTAGSEVVRVLVELAAA
jgi:hypothetical protein